jgi:hypothetical protein
MKIGSQCGFCRHLLRATPDGLPCVAFPDGVPDELYYNKRDHRKPYPGDHGVRWEAASEEHGRLWEEGVRYWEECRGHAWGEPEDQSDP